MVEDNFQWTRELSKRFFHLRLQNEWLFKKKKQAWKDLFKIVMDDGFPSTLTINHIRKKWTYSIEEYRKALSRGSKKWIYFKLFHSYYGKAKTLDKFETWNNEWRLKLIEVYGNHKDSFRNHSSYGHKAWSLVEKDLRLSNLPIECCVRDIPELWHHIIKVFYRKYRMYGTDCKNKCDWPLYKPMLEYYQTLQPEELISFMNERYNNKLNEKDYNRRRNSEEYSKELNEGNNGDEFQWTREWSESFIHIRLQHEYLFSEKKQAWKQMHSIMMASGFPDNLSCDQIRRKWSGTYLDYQKAVATNNTKWLYYDIFQQYLKEGNLSDYLQNWSEEWVMKLILARIQHDSLFVEDSICDDGWRAVEMDLKHQNVPLECSLLYTNKIWEYILREYKIKHKFALRGLLKESWPYYDIIEKFRKSRPLKSEINVLKKIKSESINNDRDYDKYSGDEKNDDHDIFADSISVPKLECLEDTKTIVEMCRVCMGLGANVYLFGNGTSVADKLSAVAGIEVKDGDNLPKLLCTTCLQELESAFEFRTKCQSADFKFRNNSYKDKSQYVFLKSESLNLNNTFNGLDDGHFNSDSDSEPLYKVKEKYKQETKIKQKKTKVKIEKKTVRKPKRRSKNVVMVPMVTAMGEQILRKRYIYKKVCEICGQSTQHMREHMKKHSEERNIKCNQCDKTFKYSSGLILHRVVHNKTPCKICQHCGKQFFHYSQYKRHIVYHLNERKYACETCGKTFNTKEILKIHGRSHTDERPYACGECGKTFRSAGCVSRHRKVHNRIENKVSVDTIVE